jgi:ABC-type multidrug transport system fused ATPase/permease subunit
MIKSIRIGKFSFLEPLKSIWFFLDRDRIKFVVWTSILFIAYFFKLIPPLIIGLIVDFFISYNPGDSLNQFYFYCFLIGSLYVFVSIIRLISKRILGDISFRSKYRVKVLGFEKLIDFSVKWHDKESSGNKVQKMLSGGDAVNNWIRLIYSEILPISVVFIGTVTIFLFLDLKFLLFITIYITLFFYIEFHYNKKISKLVYQQNKAIERSSGAYFESTNNLLSIKSLRAKAEVSRNIEKHEKDVLNISYEIRKYGIRKWQFFQILTGISLIFFLLLVGNGVVLGTMTIGFIFVSYSYFENLRHAAADITRIIDSIIENTAAIKRMMPVFLEEEKNIFGDKKFPKWEKINIRNVFFNYSSGEHDFYLDNLNLKLYKGEKIGIVGGSGSGKSTFAKLFIGLYPIEKGEFKIGDLNYYDISEVEIAKNISIVLQDTELFNMTLKENITMLKDIDPKLFDMAVSVAQLKDVIEKLPEGLNTVIGEKGYRLSGGQRQRIGIARAVCRNSDIIILDEATSALDSKTEIEILKGFEQKLKKKTMIIIAHRLSTLSSVDKIIVFDKGKIVEQGCFHELKKNQKSIFSKLWNLQNKK